MKISKKLLIGLAVVVGLLFILPFLIPMQTYLQKAEVIASEKLGAPVVIGSAHLFLLPSPRVVLSNIAVGNHQELNVEKLVVIPTISSLFSTYKTLDLKISKPVINKAALDIVAALSAKKPDNNEPTSVRVRHVKIDEMELVWPGAKYPIMNGEATLTDTYKLESATLETVDGNLEADVTPKPNSDEQLIIVKANKWTLPVGLPLLIDKAQMEMHLKGSKLEIPKIDVALYGGTLTGDAVLTWPENKGVTSWHMNGKLAIANLATKQPSSLVSKSVYLSGHLFGNGNFSAKAKQAGQLADNLRADFKFKINDGVLHGLDLVKVASLIIRQSQSGGETEFDEFSGLLNVSGKQYHIQNLKISSGLLAAAGQVKVKPSKALDGIVAVDVKNSMGLTEIPLVVSGTLSQPVVYPSKAAIAGAVAGTAVLGPGVGTSLGIKAAGALDKVKGLFGDEK